MAKKITTLEKAIVVSGFPGVGKSYAFRHYQNQFTMLDSDSSQFSWKYTEDGVKTNVRNPAFPINYINHIKENLTKADFIFVSSHEDVRRELARNGIRYYMVYPYNSPENKKEWLQRFMSRGNDPQFCKMLMDNWKVFIESMEIDIYPVHIRLGTDYEGIEFPKFITQTMLEDLIAVEQEYLSKPHNEIDMRNIKDMV